MPQHLLMIEDDARLARMVEEYLGNSGFIIRHAANALTGLKFRI
jgi:DNA-binding response OmpR family regulator